jgi:hypothetical protein
MTLNAAQIKTINTYLTKTYGETTLDGVKKTIVVYVDNKDRIYRKGILKEIQKTFSKAPFNATYPTPSKKDATGLVKISGLTVTVKASLKAKPIATGKAKFKPSDIVPSIVNEWLNSDEIIDNVKKYIKSVDLEKTVETTDFNIEEFESRINERIGDLKKFINKVRFNSTLEIKRISKLLALIDKHIKIYANTTYRLNLFADKNFSIDSFTIYFKLL